MSEQEFNQMIGKIQATFNDDDSERFRETINKMVEMLDEADQDDCYGTEGWRRNLGWER